jgi:hypothetical protein
VRLLALLAVLAAAVAVGGSSAPASRSQQPPATCEGLTICVPLAGPWVVVPGPATEATMGAPAVWQLNCPKGVIGGTDARVANSWIEITFPGRIGSPVNPGITTRDSIVFTAVSVGPRGRASSFIPFVGCIPAQGGPRTPTGRTAPTAGRPTEPIQRLVYTVELRSRNPRVRSVVGCQPDQRLVGVQTSIGLYTARRPTAAQLRAVRVKWTIRRGQITLNSARVGLAPEVAAQVQLHALCAGRLAR